MFDLIHPRLRLRFFPFRRLGDAKFLIALIGSLLLVGSFHPAQAQLPTSVGWTALPASTSLEGSGACPPNNFEGDPYLFAEGCLNVIRAWGGAIGDTNSNRLIIWGGGHNNYYGNEIYSLNLTANPITLTRLKDPTVPTNFANSENCIESIPPGTTGFAPNSRESYGGMAYIANADVMYIIDGALACGEGHGSTATWTIWLENLSNSSSWVYENPSMAGPQPGVFPLLGGSSLGSIAVYDPNSGLVFASDSSALFTYNYQTNTSTRITAVEGFLTSIYLSGVIDPVRKLFVALGGCGGGTCGAGDGVFVADISDSTTTTMQDWTAATMADPNCAQFLTGGANPISASSPGIAYDSIANDFVGWPNQGNSVYILTPDTVNQRLTCQVLTFANGPPNSAQASNTPNTSYGTFGRFQYFPALDVFVVVNDWNIPPYILRLRSGTGYTLSATPSTASVNPGGSATYTVSVNAEGSFTGVVDLSASGLPSGATASFSPSSISTSGSSTLTVTSPVGSSASSSTLTISGMSGALTQTANVNFNVTVPDFTLTATPASADVNTGGIAVYTINTSALGGFTGSINLSVSGQPAGTTASFSSNPITAGASSTLTVTTTGNTPAGSSTLTITGNGGSLSHSAPVTLTVNASGSSGGVISIDFVGLDVAMASSEVAGVIAESNWSDAAGASSGPSPLALVDQNGNPSTVTVTWTADNVWDESIADAPGNARMMKGYLDNGNQDTTTVTVSGLPSNAGGYNIYVYAQGGDGDASNKGIYQVSGSGITTTSAILTYNTVFNGTFTQATASSPNGNYVVLTIPNVPEFTLSAIPSTASNGFDRAPVNGIQIVPLGPPNPDFTISATPGSQTVDGGNNTTYTVTVSPLNGFTGTVNLTSSGFPSGATPTFSPSSVSGSGVSTLTVSTLAGSSASSSTISMTGTSGSLVHSATATLNVVAPDFSLTVSPGSVSVAPGGTANYTVTVAPLNGFTGTVSLSVADLPSGAMFTFSPSSITTSGVSTLSIITGSTTGSSTLAITGISGSLTHSANAILNVTMAGSSSNAISIDFVGLDVAMAASETAGVVPESNWNNAAGASSGATPLALVNQNGNPTTATVTWNADDVWDQSIADAPGNARMMKGYLDTGNQDTTTVTVSGLPSNADGYNIYVYAQGGSGNATNTGIYQISGPGVTAASATLTYNTVFNGTFTQATAGSLNGNYVVLTIPNVPGFTLSAIPSTASNGFERAPVNGIQIVPLP
ncbi:MAG: hypothetical protein WA748_10930 [Candidatus Acidiferrum sp.]